MRRVLAAAVICCAVLALTAAPAGAGTDKFGAIAVETNTKHFGYSFDYNSKRGAKRRARHECRIRADVPADCEVVVWVKNACAAVAYKRQGDGDIITGWGIAHTKRRAFNRALNALGDGARRLAYTCTG